MNKIDIAAQVSERTGLSRREAIAATASVFDCIAEALRAEQKVKIAGFGTFELRSTRARTALNPLQYMSLVELGMDPAAAKAQASVAVAANKKPVFKAAKPLKEFAVR